MSSKMFKTLTIICLPALLFALTFTISLNASDSQGNGKKCTGNRGYNWVGQLDNNTNKKCTTRVNSNQCYEGYGMAQAYSTKKCVDGAATDYCVITQKATKHGQGSCVWENGSCKNPEISDTKDMDHC